ncbi:phosphopantetheine-binding protein [Azospirillum sp.]|uniref:phosphopantetheine-binding protein n=1 Tax=Azospirillum sp. TaxID=34012 RepID=UPI002D6F1DEF|nr:phosphopantetheine-binding protein [Azospirillum sp.]HYD67578.1 phosphopantetheine-binding protein [Azospirillum sp.]
MDELELEVKTLIVDALKLEGIEPAEIDSTEPLFVEGLGLDSIDALELGVALRKAYGIKIESVSDDVKAHFANVRSLAAFIRSQRVG